MNIRQAVVSAQQRLVTTEAGKSSASGVIITNGIVLTCFHCLHVDSGITVNGKAAEIISVDPMFDLALLSVETDNLPTLNLGDADLGEVVFSFGNPLSLPGALLFGRVVWKSEKRIVTDIHGAPGVSGSALFNSVGELVGINHSVLGAKHIGSHYTIAVPADKLCNILSHIFNIAKPTAEEVQLYGNPTPETETG